MPNVLAQPVTGTGQLQGILKEALVQPTVSIIDCPDDLQREP
jgi:hypothetical protein